MIRALVVDDYQEHVDTLINTLSMYGCEARGTKDGYEALVICEAWKPHLVIYDGLLEGLRAWKFARTLLPTVPFALTSAPCKPYLVALTGFSSRLQRRLCEECGFDEFCTKPLELSTLLGWVQKARTRTENFVPPSSGSMDLETQFRLELNDEQLERINKLHQKRDGD
jgi:CheY-like chemotaxis protein